MNIVPKDDVGLVAHSGESEPGSGHDLDQAVSSEGAARSDLHAGRMKSLRHLFMMDVQQPATRGRTTPSPTHARQRSELALFIVVASFVLGRRFPVALRILPIRLVPLVVLLSMIVWLWRLRRSATGDGSVAGRSVGLCSPPTRG